MNIEKQSMNLNVRNVNIERQSTNLNVRNTNVDKQSMNLTSEHVNAHRQNRRKTRQLRRKKTSHPKSTKPEKLTHSNTRQLTLCKPMKKTNMGTEHKNKFKSNNKKKKSNNHSKRKCKNIFYIGSSKQSSE